MILAVLGISALIQPVLNSTGWLFISCGRTDRMFRWGIFSSIAIVCSFLIGLPFGALGVATSYTACVLLLTIPNLWYAARTTPVRVSAIALTLWQPLLATALAGLCLAALIQGLPDWATGVRGLTVAMALISLVYLAASSALARGVPPIFEVVGFLRQANMRDEEWKEDQR